MDRREFLKKSLAATAAAAVSPLMASPLTRLMEENNSKTNTVMTKKMILLNASPRKNRNTAQMLESVMKGAQEAGAECELIHLTSLNFKGCMSCMACKRTGNKCGGLCIQKDDLRPVLEKILEADALVMGSPIYWSYPTGMFRNVIERLLFPILPLRPRREDGRSQQVHRQEDEDSAHLHDEQHEGALRPGELRHHPCP